MGDGLFVHGGVTSAQEARLALAGLLTLQGGGGGLDVRTGVLAGPGTATLVTGTSATAPMQVAVGVHDGVSSRGAANGPYVMPTEAVQLVDIGAAPGSGTRVDVVWERQKDATAGVPTPDATYGAEYGVLAGTVGAGKPDLATLGPVGALELATVAVSAGAVRTTDGTVLITQTVRQTVARGGILPVPASETTAGSYVGQYRDHPIRGLERWDGTQWSSPALAGQWVDHITRPGNYSFPLPSAYTDLTNFNTSIVVPAGRQLDVEFKLPQLQVAAGADAALKLLIGGVLKDMAEAAEPAGATGVPLAAHPIRLSGRALGIGAAITVQVQGSCTPANQAIAHGVGVSSVDTQGPRLSYRFL